MTGDLRLLPGRKLRVEILERLRRLRLEAGNLLADGGRVLGITSRGNSIAEARARAYAAVDKIDWPGGFCRRDIGLRAAASLGKDTK